MKIYNTFMLAKDKDCGLVSDIIDSGDARNILDIGGFIRNLSTYKFSFSPSDHDSDILVQIQVYDDENPGPSEVVCQKWFSEVYFEDHHDNDMTAERK